jgi:hypothetical protein
VADSTHEIPYTVGDQERQQRIEDKIDAMCTLLENPLPRCAVNVEKIASLEKTRTNTRWLSGSVGIGFALYALKQFFNLIVKTGG